MDPTCSLGIVQQFGRKLPTLKNPELVLPEQREDGHKTQVFNTRSPVGWGDSSKGPDPSLSFRKKRTREEPIHAHPWRRVLHLFSSQWGRDVVFLVLGSCAPVRSEF